MNYLTEIKLFYVWLETHALSSNAIALWHGLMHIANCSGWQGSITASVSLIESKTGLARASIFRARDALQDAGRISCRSQGGRASAIYIIHSLELQFASQIRLQNGTQNNLGLHFVSQNRGQIETIYKLNYTSTKEKDKKENEIADESAPHLLPSPEKKEKVAPKRKKSSSPHGDLLSGIELPWLELMRVWLEYKRSRKENYKSELSVGKCLAQLKRLSSENPQTAQQIIDQSIANNWAGLFELKRQPYNPRGQPQPAKGQHIGQIKQPDTEEKRQRILDKFGKRD